MKTSEQASNETPNYYVRTATPEDVEIISGLAIRTFKSAYETQLPGEALDNFIASVFSTDRIREELNHQNNTFLLAVEKSEVIGYAMLRVGPHPNPVTGSKLVELARIYLDEKVIGRGYSSVLMKACLESAKAQGYGTLWLGVWEKNERAVRFYEKWGFTKVGSHEFEFGDEVHTDLVMARSIRQS